MLAFFILAQLKTSKVGYVLSLSSNDLELLKELLLKKMQEAPAAPFAKEAILVQSQGMSHWLKLQLAQGLGVAAQINFRCRRNLFGRF